MANALILFLLTRLDVEKVNTRLKEEADARAEMEAGGEAGGAVASEGGADDLDAVESLGTAAGIEEDDGSVS